MQPGQSNHGASQGASVKTRSHVLGFDENRLQLAAGERGVQVLHPQCLFRGDRLYFETLGLTIDWVKVGSRDQGIVGVPSSYYNERSDKDGMKGRPVKLDTAEVGKMICIALTNHNPHSVIVAGCIEGMTAGY